MSRHQATSFTALRRMAGPSPDAEPDEDLLRKFCADREEGAFAAIVRRYGGLVLDVCRTALRNEADAEDAFQATFIALAADARRIRRPAALAGWLHATAFRTAAKARRARGRRRAREARVPVRPAVPAPDPSWAEVRQAIHDEVYRLPDRYRAAVVLFYLAGRTQDEVGRALGLSTAGAKKRLERGRDLLRVALDGRGFGPTAVLAAAALSLPTPASTLAASATASAVGFATNRGALPPAVLSLLSTGARSMSAKIAFGTALLLGVATTVGLGVLRGGPAGQAERPDGPPGKVKAGDGPGKKPPARPAAEMERFRALDPADRLKLVEKLAEADTPFAPATRGDLVATVVERGSLEPAASADVICKVKAKDKESTATTVKWVIDEGSLVKKGDRVALLDDAALRDRIQVQAVKVKEAEAAVAQAAETVGLIQKENDIEVRLAEIDVKLAEVELADPAAGRAKPVLELKVEQAKLKVERARSRAKAQLAKAEAEKRAKAAALDLAARRQRDGEAELKLCLLAAPIDGMVTYPAPAAGRFAGAAVMVEPGASVREGQKLLSVIDLKQLVLATRVHEAVISTVRVGQAARVRIDAFPDMVLRGKVIQVSPVASAPDWRGADLKVYPVTIAIEDAPPGLKPSMTAEVRIVTGERKAALQVPVNAIVRVGNERFCFVKSGREVVERKVVPGAASATAVEITDGLTEGDLVVTDLPGLLARP